jgi:hypothetical protein
MRFAQSRLAACTREPKLVNVDSVTTHPADRVLSFQDRSWIGDDRYSARGSNNSDSLVKKAVGREYWFQAGVIVGLVSVVPRG